MLSEVTTWYAIVATQKCLHCKQDLKSTKIIIWSLFSFTQLHKTWWSSLGSLLQRLWVHYLSHTLIVSASYFYTGNFNRLSQIVKRLWISILVWWVLNRFKRMDLVHYSFTPLILFRVPYTFDLLLYYLLIANGTGGVGIFELLVFQCFV